jgi:hypothetical protein
MGLFRDMLNEARNASVPTEYRIALGQLKRMYNTGEVPSEKELQKDAEMIAKKNHIEEDKFFEFVKSQFKINESELVEAKMTAKEFIEDAGAYVKNIEHTDSKDAKLFKTKVINRLKEKRNKATGNAKAELIKAIEELSSGGDLSEAKSKEDLIKYYEKNLKNVEKEYSTDSRKQEYIDYAKGQLAAVKKDGNDGLIKFLKDWNMNESAVGTPGRTTVKDAEDHIDDELIAEFKKIIKKLGGKTVAKVLLDKLGQKPEIKDEIDHIEDIIDNSNY